MLRARSGRMISSWQIAGHPTGWAILCASVVSPAPDGPVTTISVGREATLAVPLGRSAVGDQVSAIDAGDLAVWRVWSARNSGGA